MRVFAILALAAGLVCSFGAQAQDALGVADRHELFGGRERGDRPALRRHPLPLFDG